MDHDTVVRQKMPEKYLLGELSSEIRDEFEEHFFDCKECALDVQAGSLFVEQSKIVLAERSVAISGNSVAAETSSKPGWLSGLRSILRPVTVVPVLALLTVIGYQNLVTYPQLTRQLNSPQVLAWAPVNVGTYGSEGPVITTHPGEGFLLFARIPPDSGYAHYAAELYNPAGKLEWSLTIPVTSAQAAAEQDQWPVQVPGANRDTGTYTLKVRGVTATGESKEVGQASFELKSQK